VNQGYWYLPPEVAGFMLIGRGFPSPLLARIYGGFLKCFGSKGLKLIEDINYLEY
jgi:hypothetical protein